ncbi:hypothetical protein [Herpetosiphon sp. NSE202]|uniref:hypothetical protein n=1 Tax=Herpetosiphon sp. NSE202 TaxID=3351349 RepID=UPI00363F378E
MVHHGFLRSMMLLALLISGLLLSCGRNQSSEPLSGQPASTVAPADTTATAVAVATQAELNESASVVAFKDKMAVQQTQEMWDLATVEAGGVLPTITQGTIEADLAEIMTSVAHLDNNFSPTPKPLPAEGQAAECNHGTDTIRGNCWTVNDRSKHVNYHIFAGALSANPNQGMIIVYAFGNLLTIEELRRHEYHTPQVQGILMVDSATWPLVYITTQTTPTQHLIFNLETRQWLDPNGTPIPVSATPTSTDK